MQVELVLIYNKVYDNLSLGYLLCLKCCGCLQVTYKNGVYDVSEFVSEHPGGDKILLAAGRSVEPYFELYGIHKTREVMEMVEVRLSAGVLALLAFTNVQL